MFLKLKDYKGVRFMREAWNYVNYNYLSVYW